MNLDGAHAKTHFNEYAYAINRNVQLACNFRNGDAFFAGVANAIENAHVAESACSLKTERCEGDLLGLELGINGVDGVFLVKIKHNLLGVVYLFGM